MRHHGQIILADGQLGNWVHLSRAEEILFNDVDGIGKKQRTRATTRTEVHGSSWILASGDEAGLPGVSLLRPLRAAIPATLAWMHTEHRLALRLLYSQRAAVLRRGVPVSSSIAAKWLQHVGAAPLGSDGCELQTCCAILGSQTCSEARRNLGYRNRTSILGPWHVYATKTLEPGEEVELCPLLVLPDLVTPACLPGIRLQNVKLGGDSRYALPLGFSTIYASSSSSKANVHAYVVNLDGVPPQQALRLIAARRINVGEELIRTCKPEQKTDLDVHVAYNQTPADGAVYKMEDTELEAGLGKVAHEWLNVLRPSVQVEPSSKLAGDRGVFARRDFKAGEVVELCPALVFKTDAMASIFQDYVMEGSLLNTSNNVSTAELKQGDSKGEAQKTERQGHPPAKKSGGVPKTRESVLALGTGALYNHGGKREQNAWWMWAKDLEVIVILALKDVNKGQEILISYTDTWWQHRGVVPQ